MKSLYLSLVLIILSNIVLGQNAYNLSQNQLKGNVKYHETITYDVRKSNGKWIKFRRATISVFDQNIWFDEKGRYKKLQKITSEGNVFEEQLFVYNEDGKLQEIKHFQNGNEYQKTYFEYKNNLRVSEKVFSIDENKIIERFEYTYDNLGRKTSEIYYEDNEITYKNIYFYTPVNEDFLEINDFTLCTFKEFNANGLLERSSVYNDEKHQEFVETFVYNQDNILTQVRKKSIQKWETNTYYEYDENNNLIKKVTKEDNFKNITNLMNVDEAGNCTKFMEYNGDRLIFIKEYTIEYF